MIYIVLDLEFNQPFSFKSGVKASADPMCPFEIIQIGAVKLDHTFTIIDEFSTYVKPKIYKRIHPFVEKITGITKADVKDGLPFPLAYEGFLNFISMQEEAVLCTWGGDDIKSLLRNILYHQLELELLPQQSLNVQKLASLFLKQEPGKSIGLQNAVELLGIQGVEGHFHDALCDAIYTGKVLQLVHPAEVKTVRIQAAELLAPKLKKPRVNTRKLLAHFRDNLDRDLTEEEADLIKQAYRLGRNQAFDVVVEIEKNK